MTTLARMARRPWEEKTGYDELATVKAVRAMEWSDWKMVIRMMYSAMDQVNRNIAEKNLKAITAKDMGVWHVSLVLPQLLATPLGGFLRDAFQEAGKKGNEHTMLGYTVIFLVSFVYFAMATCFVNKIKAVK